MEHAHKQQLAKFEGQINDLAESLKSLTATDDLAELLRHIHQPGWTTPAELLFAAGIVAVMQSHVAVLTDLKQVLLDGSRAVTHG